MKREKRGGAFIGVQSPPSQSAYKERNEEFWQCIPIEPEKRKGKSVRRTISCSSPTNEEKKRGEEKKKKKDLHERPI